MSRRGKVAAVILVVLGAGGAAALWDPARRVRGWVNGEPFFGGRAAGAWQRDLRDSDAVLAARAKKSLAAGKAAALPVCSWLLRSAPEPQVRARAIDAIGGMGSTAADAGADLVAALSDRDPLVRAAAARLLGELAPRVDGAVAPLIALFPDREALRAVASYRQHASAAVPALIELTRHPDPAVRRQAVRTLGRIGEPAHGAIPRLMVVVIEDPEPGVREFAAAVLGEFGSAAAPAIPILARALADTDAGVRREAVAALGRLGTAARIVLDDVAALAADPDEAVQTAARKAIRQIDPNRK